jgi:hypothetical protein
VCLHISLPTSHAELHAWQLLRVHQPAIAPTQWGCMYSRQETHQGTHGVSLVCRCGSPSDPTGVLSRHGSCWSHERSPASKTRSSSSSSTTISQPSAPHVDVKAGNSSSLLSRHSTRLLVAIQTLHAVSSPVLLNPTATESYNTHTLTWLCRRTAMMSSSSVMLLREPSRSA